MSAQHLTPLRPGGLAGHVSWGCGQLSPWLSQSPGPRAETTQGPQGGGGRASTQQGCQSCRKAAPGLGVFRHPQTPRSLRVTLSPPGPWDPWTAQTSRSSRVTLSPPGPQGLQIPPGPKESQGHPESTRTPSGSSDTPRPRGAPASPRVHQDLGLLTAGSHPRVTGSLFTGFYHQADGTRMLVLYLDTSAHGLQLPAPPPNVKACRKGSSVPGSGADAGT